MIAESVFKPIGMEHVAPKIKRWHSVLTVLSGFAVLFCICAMVLVHHRMHAMAEDTSSDHMLRDAKRLVSILGYQHSRCRDEVSALARGLQPAIPPAGTGNDLRAKNGESPGSKIQELGSHWLLNQDHGSHPSLYRRILVIDADNVPLYDSQPADAAAPPFIMENGIRTVSSPAAVLVHDHDILITAAIEPTDPSTGFVVAWLNGHAFLRQITAHPMAPGQLYSLIDNTGRIIFPETLPEEVRSIGPDQLMALDNGTVATLEMTSIGSPDEPIPYLAMALPVANTPLKLLSIIPVSETFDQHHSIHYAIIATALLLTILFFYRMQQHINCRNVKLMNRYNETQRQYKIMVRNNEDLANEILLRKRAESELKIVNENLEEIVKHRTYKLKSALNDLQTTQSQLIQSGKLASIGELAAGIAHELNQPLMVIRGNAQLMARKQKKSKMDPDQLPSFFDTIERNTKRMILIINHLRSFSRQSDNDFQSVDINQVIKESFLMIGEQMRLRNIETTTNLSKGLPYIKGDPYQLEQVFLNLLTNARDAIDADQTEENGYRQKKEIVITTRLKNGGSNMVEILFKDTGCGIAAKDMDKIFDPFYTTKEVGKGTGLGLSISYGILQQHGGHLEFVDTTPGNTTLIVVLPCQ